VLKLTESEPAPCPTTDMPLGVPFPGYTWTGGLGTGPNWVSREPGETKRHSKVHALVS
jgi:hypothetical protein